MQKPKKIAKIKALIQQIDQLIQVVGTAEQSWSKQLEKVHPNFLKSAHNLIHYRAMRMQDNRELQKGLGSLGLSRLARSETHLMASLFTTKKVLHLLAGENSPPIPPPGLSFKKSKRLLKSNTKSLFGYRSRGRRTRIMVTQPSEAAENKQLVEQMVAAGMNCARINCAHDDEIVWGKIIHNVRKAADKLGKKVKIAMDLAGPKIRTGAIKAGPRVLKLRPLKDIHGIIRQPLRIWIGPEPQATNVPHLPLPSSDLGKLTQEATLYLRDTRGKKRKITIVTTEENGCWGHVHKTTYLATGLALHLDAKYQTAPIPVGTIPQIEQALLLQKGNILVIHKERKAGEPAHCELDGTIIRPAHISCTAQAVFAEVKTGEPIRFDDGKIEGIIREVESEQFSVEITNEGGKLKSDKGINFPDSQLSIRGLTQKDRQDLPFVAAHADVINFSFVNSPQDVVDLLEALKDLEASEKLGVVLKIETQSGYNQLTAILLTAMRIKNVGVMIARGDLAIEVGWDNIARVQEEILSLCQAAHVPDVWATQVLENLAKRGVPSRAEITDAAMAQRAECVMLNKGPHIIQAIELLDNILKNMLKYRDKKTPMLPIMEPASS